MFLVWKTLHVAAVVVFLGNITIGFFWASLARRTGDAKTLHFTFNGLTLADRYITNPAAFAVIVSGLIAAVAGNYSIFTTVWIVLAFALLAISGVLFASQIAPLQRSIASMFASATNADNSDDLWSRFEAQYGKLRFWGLLSLAAAYGAMALMVLKPAF